MRTRRDEITTEDSSALGQDVSIVGRVDPSHPTPMFHRPAIRDDSSYNGRKSFNNWPVILYIPNLLGYVRILLAFHGMKLSIQQHFNKALNTWIAAAILDLIDGIAARKLNQCSQFGILLDIIADNILRTAVWISCILLVASERKNADANNSTNIICAYTAIICLEWMTMFCSQCNQASREDEAQSGHHWKDIKRKGNESSNPPFWVEAVFSNNFRSSSGILAIYGLFVAPLGSYVLYASNSSTTISTTWPTHLLSEQLILILIIIAYIGRSLSAAVELWLCWQYLRGVIARDSCCSTKNKEV